MLSFPALSDLTQTGFFTSCMAKGTAAHPSLRPPHKVPTRQLQSIFPQMIRPDGSSGVLFWAWYLLSDVMLKAWARNRIKQYQLVTRFNWATSNNSCTSMGERITFAEVPWQFLYLKSPGSSVSSETLEALTLYSFLSFQSGNCSVSTLTETALVLHEDKGCFLGPRAQKQLRLSTFKLIKSLKPVQKRKHHHSTATP